MVKGAPDHERGSAAARTKRKCAGVSCSAAACHAPEESGQVILSKSIRISRDLDLFLPIGADDLDSSLAEDVSDFQHDGVGNLYGKPNPLLTAYYLDTPVVGPLNENQRNELNLHRGPRFLAAYNQKECFWNKPWHNVRAVKRD